MVCLFISLKKVNRKTGTKWSLNLLFQTQIQKGNYGLKLTIRPDSSEVQFWTAFVPFIYLGAVLMIQIVHIVVFVENYNTITNQVDRIQIDNNLLNDKWL